MSTRSLIQPPPRHSDDDLSPPEAANQCLKRIPYHTTQKTSQKEDLNR